MFPRFLGIWGNAPTSGYIATITPMVTTSLVFDHRGRASASQPGPIEVRITHNRLARYVSTGVRVLKKNWQSGLVVDRFDANELNDRLAIILRRVNSLINQLMADGTGIDADYIRRNLITSTAADPDSFLRWVDAQIPLLNVNDATRKHYETLARRLADFGQIRRWQDLTVENIYKFNAWLKTQTIPQTPQQIRQGIPPRPLKQPTIKNYHKNFRALMSRALKTGMLKTVDEDPYTRLRGEFSAKYDENIEYLTEDEINKILDFQPAPGTELSTARDLFIVQMFTGLAYTDAETLDLTQYKYINGRWIYNGQRIKTGVGYVSSLLPPVVEVLQRYGWSVPQIANQHYNESLKILGRTLGIQSRMHSHLARHTFATYMLRHGVEVQNLQRMMGHSRIEQTMKYAKVLALSVHEEFEKIAKTLTK